MIVRSSDAIFAEMSKLMLTSFRSPIWDAESRKWFRCLNLDTGEPDRGLHFYYDICNVYAIGRVLSHHSVLRQHYLEPWLDAALWLFWNVINRPAVGYAGYEITDNRDQYAFALVSAALAQTYATTGHPAFLREASRLFESYRAAFPVAATVNIQASSHAIVSALSLNNATGDARYLEDAQREGAFLLDRCRIGRGSAAGCFSEDGRVTGCPRHCYGSWAMTELHRADGEQKWLDAAAVSFDWILSQQRQDGGVYFFFDNAQGVWTDRTVYSVHQKGMLLHGAWAIARRWPGKYDAAIERIMNCCDDSVWHYQSPQGWQCFRRSMTQRDVVYSYELGWELLGLSFGLENREPARA